MKNESLINELSGHALMFANEIRRLHPDEQEKYELAYSRAKSFAEVKCPRCWVEKEEYSSLVIEARANEVDEYACKSCGFNGVLPKLEH